MQKVLAILLSLLMLLPFSAFGEQTHTVVTSFYPIYIFARNLTQGIDAIQVQNLAAPDTGCLHDYQLLTGDMRTLQGARVLLINGAGMESYLDTVFNQFPSLPIMDASQGIELLDAQGEPAGHHLEEAAEGHDHEHEENAHIWLNARNAMVMVENLQKGLSAVFPEYQNLIAENAQNYLARLSALDTELTSGLQHLPHKDIITFHEAFPYFANAYGLHVAAVVTHEPGEALSPAELAALVTTVKNLGNPPLFTEPQYPDLAAKTLAAETGAFLYSLDPLVTGPMEDGVLTAYEDGMRKNMQVLITALSK